MSEYNVAQNFDAMHNSMNPDTPSDMQHINTDSKIEPDPNLENFEINIKQGGNYDESPITQDANKKRADKWKLVGKITAVITVIAIIGMIISMFYNADGMQSISSSVFGWSDAMNNSTQPIRELYTPMPKHIQNVKYIKLKPKNPKNLPVKQLKIAEVIVYPMNNIYNDPLPPSAYKSVKFSNAWLTKPMNSKNAALRSIDHKIKTIAHAVGLYKTPTLTLEFKEKQDIQNVVIVGDKNSLNNVELSFYDDKKKLLKTMILNKDNIQILYDNEFPCQVDQSELNGCLVKLVNEYK